MMETFGATKKFEALGEEFQYEDFNFNNQVREEGSVFES
jgi:hypothetical protein